MTKIFERGNYKAKRENFLVHYACTLELSGFPILSHSPKFCLVRKLVLLFIDDEVGLESILNLQS